MFKLKLRPHPHKTEKYLEKLKQKEYFKVLDNCAKEGVEALAENTPKRTGLTAASWSYEIEATRKGITIVWKNDNLTENGEPIAIMLQYGHATGSGGYVAGIDYINPAIRPVFDNIADEVWKVMVDL